MNASSRFPHSASVGSEGLKMACLVFPSFAVSLRAAPLLLLSNGVHEFDFAVRKLSRKATISICAVQKVLGSCSSNKHILSLKGRGSCQHYLLSSARFLHDTCFYKGYVDHFTEIVISGYWVGPDPDDGWGYVEAVIDLMT